jgi:hypothetical protein
MIVGAEDGALRVYDLMDPKLTDKYEGFEGAEGHVRSVTCVAFPSEGAQYRCVWPRDIIHLFFIGRNGAALACAVNGSRSLPQPVAVHKICKPGSARASQAIWG